MNFSDVPRNHGLLSLRRHALFAATPIAAGRALPFLDENGKKETDGYKIVRMDEKKLSAELQRQGFLQTCVWQDAPGTFYPEHTHRTETAHIVLERRDELDDAWPHGDLWRGRPLRCTRRNGTLGKDGATGLPLFDWGAVKQGDLWRYRAAGFSCGARARSSSSTTCRTSWFVRWREVPARSCKIQPGLAVATI